MFISAGHSNKDPGAVSGDRREADIAVEMRNIVSFYLTRAGIKHQVDATGTDNLPLDETVAITSKKNEVKIEFHCNASANMASGCEILCAPKDEQLAVDLCKAIASTLGIRNRDVKPENAGHHSRLAFVQAGGIIVELFFITNPDDVAKYDAKKWLVGKAIAEVLSAHS